MRGMARDLHRTTEDAALDALAALDAAQRELAHWRAHLERLAVMPEPGIGQQAFHAARIVTGIVGQAKEHSAEAARLAEAHASSAPTSLRSVS